MRSRTFVTVVCGLLCGCTTFAVPRPAEVQPGPSGTATLSVATPPGDAAAWFWSFYCARKCNRWIPAVAMEYVHGFVPEGGASYELGAGVNGIIPFVHAYVQLARGAGPPWGIGARLGIPVVAVNSHQIFGRVAVARVGKHRILFNPAVLYHGDESSINGGRFVGVIPAFGWFVAGERVSTTLGVAPAFGWTRRDARRESERSAFRTFGVASFSITVHRARP